MVNTKKINSRIMELGYTQKDVALYLNVAQPTVSQKLNNIRPMDLNEAEMLCKLLKIKDEEFGEYFFYHGVA